MLALALIAASFFAFSTTGCGDNKTQAADAPSGTWSVSVEQWKFPRRQYLGTPTEFVLKVRNTDSREIPQLIVTVYGLKTKVYQPGAASEVRPIWLTSDVNYANVTPYNSTLASSWNLGPLAAGAVATYKVNLTPLRRGEHQVGYKLAPALFGDNKIVNGSDQTPAVDTRTVAIDPTPQFDEKVFSD